MTKFRWKVVQSRDELEAFYRSILPKLIRRARHLGYSLTAHGSFRRDLDLIAVAWVDSAVGPDRLAAALHKAACGLEQKEYSWESKPRGRWTTSMPICWPEWPGKKEPGLCHIDLSVVGSM